MKSKIEEKIEKAREATNEMFAALEELNEMLKEKEPEKWLPKDGEYCAHTDKVGHTLICIYKNKEREVLNYYVGCKTWLSYRLDFYDWCITEWIDRPATPSEIALLDSKLAGQGKRFDKEKLEIVDIQKHKEPIIGEMMICWDKYRGEATCRLFSHMRGAFYIDHKGMDWNNAILFESPEQYKAFLKS